MKKRILIFSITTILILIISCNNTTEMIKEQNVYYKLYSKKDSLIGYSIRKYVFKNDTIKERYLSINLSGERTVAYKRDFLKKGDDVFIFSNIKNDKSKFLYFSPNKIDTCLHIDRKIESFYLCNKGKINFKKFKNVFKVYYDERGYDTRKETLIIDKNCKVIARFEDCYNYEKEISLGSEKINKDVLLKFKKVIEKILWW